jgi:alpha-L-rhamnosidase
MRRSCNLLLSALVSMAMCVLAQQPLQNLEQGFKNPPDSAKPRVWWHWMNGNITREGIKLDLEWMKRVGIGGFQGFDASLGTPKLVDKRLVYMTPEWKDAFRYTTQLADQLGLEEAIAGSPGWSESGGPWVEPSEAMKKIVWSETAVQGGQHFTGTLPKPPSVSGPFQNIPIMDFVAMLSGQTPPKPADFYRDTAVIAYRLPEGDVSISELQPKITSSAGTIDAPLLWDGDLVKTNSLPMAPMGQQAWIQFEFSKPQTIRAITLVIGGMKNPFADPSTILPGPGVQTSDDGQNFRKIVTLPGDGAAENTIALPETTARFFRVSFTTPPAANPFPGLDLSVFGVTKLPPPPTDHKIAELVLHPGARVSRFEEKAAFATLPDLYLYPTPSLSSSDVVRKSDVLDLTSKMRPDGTLDWTPPQGRWTILRMGYSLTGVTNHPASPEGTGPEVDKLNPEHVKAYMTTYLDNYKSAVGPLMGKRGLQYVINDSWEAGTQNWTENLVAEFSKRRGYDLRPWMPVLTGRVVESSEASDRFLWDFRKTLSDMLTDYHYDLIETLLKERGMAHYGESHEEGRAFIGDGMEVKRSNDVPMSAMWTQVPGVNKEQYGYDADIRESASVAHIYGQNLVAAESLTAMFGPWFWSPATLKPTADQELAMGLNRFVIHTSVHQPLTDGRTPGISLGPFGQWFTRNETWAEQAKVWTTYLARNSYLLQQGRFAADVVYFYGEDSNLTALFLHRAPDIPAGYNFDYINADALIHKLSFGNGELTTTSGMRYHVLALDPFSQHMSLPVLRKIRDLVAQGATVVGLKPVSTPSLSDNPAEFQSIADELWSTGSGPNKFKGHVYGDKTLADVLESMQVAPDFTYTKSQPDTRLLFVHRTLSDGDLYYVDNRHDRAETVTATFRVQGKEAELWHADTGGIEPASFQISGGKTTVPLQLEPWGTVFVVFRKPTPGAGRVVPKLVESSLATIEGPWRLAFQPNRGAPAQVTFEKLTAWNENADEGVKYFSGTGTYTKTIQAPPEWFRKGARLWLDIGKVRNIAEVTVNGKSAGVARKIPYRLNVTDVLKPGENELRIDVINAWVNRMIGDRQPNATTKYTFTTPVFYKTNSPLVPSGLLGPVQILQSMNEN